MSNNTQRYTGIVKWFKRKTGGFGFITIIDEGENKNKDVFVHHSSIHVSNPQYKYLVPGEYVEFEMVPASINVEEHAFQASNVSGIKKGKLMCETTQDIINQQTVHTYSQKSNFSLTSPRTHTKKEPRETREPRESKEPRATTIK